MVAKLLSGVYEELGVPTDRARLFGAAVSTFAGFITELGDGRGKYGFSYEDLVFDTLGAAMIGIAALWNPKWPLETAAIAVWYLENLRNTAKRSRPDAALSLLIAAAGPALVLGADDPWRDDEVLVREISDWVLADDPGWPFSYVNACAAVGIDAVRLRRELGAWLESVAVRRE